MAFRQKQAFPPESRPETGAGIAGLRFAPPVEGLRFLRESAGLLPHMAWRHLRVKGPDAIDYMHRRLAQSVRQLPEGRGIHALQLDGEGRMQADLLVYRTGPEELTVLVERDHANAAQQIIEKYVITENVTVEPLWMREAVIGVAGPRAQEALEGILHPGELRLQTSDDSWLAVPDAELKDFPERTACVLRDGRWSTPFFHVCLPQNSMQTVQQTFGAACEKLGGGAVDDVAFDYFRISQGITRFGVDTTERTIPLDACLRDALDLNKGCFPGQEFLARINNLGHPANELVRLEIPGEHVVPRDTPVLARTPEGDVEAGRITSARSIRGIEPTVALAFLKWKHRNEPAVAVQLHQQRLEARVIPLPGRTETRGEQNTLPESSE